MKRQGRKIGDILKVVFWLPIAVSFTLFGCALLVDRRPPLVIVPVEDPAPLLWEDLDFGADCYPTRGPDWKERAERDPADLLRGAACLITVAENTEAKRASLAAAESARQLAAAATERWTGSATAHYLLAYSTALVAERRPLQALSLVPEVERQALRAAALNPAIHEGGPYRMLAELYLRAPGFPVSIGDGELAVEYFYKAVAQGPAHLENRLGLVEALLEERNPAAACGELTHGWRLLAPDPGQGPWRRALDLQDRLCGGL